MEKLKADEVRPGDVLLNDAEDEALHTVTAVAKSTATGHVFALVADNRAGGEEPIYWSEDEGTPYVRGSEFAHAQAERALAEADASTDADAE